MGTKQITDVGALVDELGGLPATARFFGTTTENAWNWRERGRLPQHRYFEQSEALRARGIEAPRTLWGFAEAERAA